MTQSGQQDTVFFKDMSEQQLAEYDNLWRNEYDEISRELSSITLRIGNSRIPILKREGEELEEQIKDIEFEMKVRGLSGNFLSNNPLESIAIGMEVKKRDKNREPYINYRLEQQAYEDKYLQELREVYIKAKNYKNPDPEKCGWSNTQEVIQNIERQFRERGINLPK